MDELATVFSFNNWPGHLSYLLIAISYWLSDMFWLRLVAIVGLLLEILYFYVSGGDLRTGTGWDLIFIAINAYQLYRLLQDRLSLRLPEADRELLRSVLAGLDDARLRGCWSPASLATSRRDDARRGKSATRQTVLHLRWPCVREDCRPRGVALGQGQLRRRSRLFGRRSRPLRP
jgi:hypothetical protein